MAKRDKSDHSFLKGYGNTPAKHQIELVQKLYDESYKLTVTNGLQGRRQAYYNLGNGRHVQLDVCMVHAYTLTWKAA